MNVTQADSRSISIVSDTGVRFSVPYHFFWNGQDRPAESIVLTSPGRGRREKPQGKGGPPRAGRST